MKRHKHTRPLSPAQPPESRRVIRSSVSETAPVAVTVTSSTIRPSRSLTIRSHRLAMTESCVATIHLLAGRGTPASRDQRRRW